MKNQYTVYKVSVDMPLVYDSIKPGCTIGNENGAPYENIMFFDTEEDALTELSKHTSRVFRRIECRNAYYEIYEWRMEKVDNSIKNQENIKVAKMDLSEIEDPEPFFGTI